MENPSSVVDQVSNKRSKRSYKRRLNWKLIWISCLIIIVLGFSGIFYYQATRFNSNIAINHINVGGLTVNQAIQKLSSSVLKNKVYLGEQLLFNEKETKMAFTNQDSANVRKLLQKQRTLFPSTKAINFSLMPSKGDPYRSQILKKQLEDKLVSMNRSLKAPQDPKVVVEDGKVIIPKGETGKQYDVTSLVSDYQNQEYNSEIHLKPVYIQPNQADNPTLKKQVQLLQELLQRTVVYKVQDQVYTLKASDLIKTATLTKDFKYVFDTGGITNKIAEINSTQSTLNKNYQFRTHSGSMISVKGQSYGWSIDISEETKRIKEAFQNGEKTLSAENIYGVGWNHRGIGYQVTSNNGIGDTYAEVSIREQRIWLYKNGQLKLTTPVVTGWHGVNQDTPTGVWYIEYKQSPSILSGSEVGNLNYHVKVTYWAPFTLNGCGFHDAGWRRNWSSTAYLTNGSGGCVNVPPGVMKSVYDNLSQNEPVVIY